MRKMIFVSIVSMKVRIFRFVSVSLRSRIEKIIMKSFVKVLVFF